MVFCSWKLSTHTRTQNPKSHGKGERRHHCLVFSQRIDIKQLAVTVCINYVWSSIIIARNEFALRMNNLSVIYIKPEMRYSETNMQRIISSSFNPAKFGSWVKPKPSMLPRQDKTFSLLPFDSIEQRKYYSKTFNHFLKHHQNASAVLQWNSKLSKLLCHASLEKIHFVREQCSFYCCQSIKW